MNPLRKQLAFRRLQKEIRRHNRIFYGTCQARNMREFRIRVEEGGAVVASCVVGQFFLSASAE